MPQLDLFSYFSSATVLIILFLTLIFILNTYYLPKLASCLKFRKKIQMKQESKSNTMNADTKRSEEGFLEISQIYINEMEKIIKTKIK